MRHWVVFNKATFNQNANLYKIMANPIRLEILNRLRLKDQTVEELRESIGIRKANLSQHLSILRYNNLVKAQRNGQSIHYSLSKPRLVEACKILKEVSEELPVG